MYHKKIRQQYQLYTHNRITHKKKKKTNELPFVQIKHYFHERFKLLLNLCILDDREMIM